MPPLPKKKHSRKRRSGRAAHFKVVTPALAECPQCRSPRISHRVCSSCGYYNGREVIVTDPES